MFTIFERTILTKLLVDIVVAIVEKLEFFRLSFLSI